MTDTSTKSPSSKTRPVTFSPEELQRVISQATAEAVASATAALKAEMAEAIASKPAKMTVAGRTERSIRNELLVRREFKKHGFGEVTPHKDVKTFGKWQAECRRPLEGSKAVKAGGLRLFHISQTRPLTKEEIGEAQMKDVTPSKKAVTKGKSKGGQVIPIGNSPQS